MAVLVRDVLDQVVVVNPDRFIEGRHLELAKELAHVRRLQRQAAIRHIGISFESLFGQHSVCQKIGCTCIHHGIE